MRIKTSVLNQVVNEAIAIVQPPSDKGKRLKILYGTQASTKPPTFVIFVNNKDLFQFSYERYLVNQIRKEFGLQATPIRIIVREKVEKNNMVVNVIMAIIAYLIGSINFSVIFSKKVAGFDVREKGSGNAGSTNMLRSVGKGAAVLTLLYVTY